MRLEGSTWTQVSPGEKGEFTCDKSSVLPMDPAISGITLDKDRMFSGFVTG